MKSRRSLVVLLTGLLATAVLPPASVAAHEDVVCDLGWFEVQLREDIAPEGVIAFDPDEPWIAGGTMLGGGRRSAAVLHGLGDDAVLEEPPLPDTRDSGLMAIGGAGPGEPLWAVGFGRETDYVAAYVARRDEDGWGRTETIRPTDFNAALTDVDADLESGAWAAGFLQGQPGDQRPWVLELREDGRTGSRPPLADGERATLAGISVSDEGGVWVAGTALTDEHMEPYLARREGDDWDRFVLDSIGDAAFSDIDVPTADEGWVVGHRLEGSTIEPLVLHWDGAAWFEIEAPDFGADPALLTSVSHADGVVAVGGTSWDRERGRYAAMAARLVDGEWIVSYARRGWGMGTITDISGDPGSDGWAVGRADEGIIGRVCDGDPLTGAPETTVEVLPAPTEVIDPVEPSPLGGAVAAVDVAEAAGVPTESQSWSSLAADFDNDGLDDLFIGRHGARARLYH